MFTVLCQLLTYIQILFYFQFLPRRKNESIIRRSQKHVFEKRRFSLGGQIFEEMANDNFIMTTKRVRVLTILTRFPKRKKTIKTFLLHYIP